MKNKLKAFTVLEFTIAMVLTSLIIGFAYQAWGLISQQTIRSGNKQNEFQEIRTLEYLMHRDFLEAKTVSRSGNEISIQSETPIQYYWTENYITRSQAALIDTFYFSIMKSETSMEFLPIEEGTISSWTLGLKDDKESFEVFAQKEYSAMDKMNFENLE